MQQHGRTFLAAGTALLVGFGVLLGLTGTSNAIAISPLRPANPLNATPEQIGQLAIDVVEQNHLVLSGTPQVVLARRVTSRDLDKMGLPSLSEQCLDPEPPRMLVILRGDFDWRHATMSSAHVDPATYHWRVAYAVYLFDLQGDRPYVVLTMPSWRGGILRQALNDPSLLDDLPVVTPQTSGIPLTPLPRLTTCAPTSPYGTIAPTVAPIPAQ